jgi:ectoine hydroxylase-related dioxygenase (phytanoyl-CoA dioxygenase family)
MHDDVQEKFLKDGFLFPVNFLTAKETLFYGRKYNEYVKKYGTEGSKGESRRIRGNRIFRVHLLAQWAAQLVRHPGLISLIKQALDTENILIWSSDITCKPSSSTECFGWHQDEAYALLGPDTKLATAWIALTDSNPSNGCVKFIRGSNNLGQLAHKSQIKTPEENLVLGQVVADTTIVQNLSDKIVDCGLRAGEASIHAWRTIHSSQPNHSTQDRVGLAVRYMAGEVEPVHKPTVVKELVTLAAGQYHGQDFEIEDEPQGEYGKEEWALHK